MLSTKGPNRPQEKVSRDEARQKIGIRPKKKNPPYNKIKEKKKEEEEENF